MQKLLLFSFLVFTSIIINAQDLITSSRSSFYTYIFRLSDEEAHHIYQKDLEIVDDSFFHTAIDSFQTGQVFTKKLPLGHYLFAFAQSDSLVYALHSVGQLQVKMLNNKNDLAIHLHDSVGRTITNAKVFVKNHEIPFDNQTQSFRLKNTYRRGLLAITYQGFTSYHVVDTQYKNNHFKKILRRVVFGFPLGIAVNPFYDAFWSVKRHSPQGIYWKMAQLFKSYWWENHFDSFEIEDRKERKFSEKHKGIVLFNKPRYRLNDTVYLKVLLTKKGKPVSKTLETKLFYTSRNTHKSLKITELKPYRAGAYEYFFVLKDSLEMTYGTICNIYFEKLFKNKNTNKSRTYLSASFRYEDYELKSNKFTLRTSQAEYYKGDKVILFAKGTDESDLPVMDARIKLTVLPERVANFTDREVFVKDTVWQFEQKLDATGETRITLPDSLWVNADITYKIFADFLNANNEKHEQSQTFTCYFQPDIYRLLLRRDSVIAENLQKNVPEKVWFVTIGQEGKIIERKNITLPFKALLNPYAKEYHLIENIDGNEKKVEVLQLQNQPANLEVFTDRNADSVKIDIINARHLPFWYTIYHKNHRIASGFSKADFAFHHKGLATQKYFLSLQYVWNNEITELEYEIPLHDRQLQITSEHPETAAPGQAVPFKILVKDIKGRPVPNADLTAWAATKKFPELTQPQVPDFSKHYKNRKLLNTFYLNQRFKEGSKDALKLRWKRWREEMGLDSIAYFKFLYPESGRYLFYKKASNGISQIAPYVIENGELQQVATIFIDDEPVYFQLTETGQRYSFPADSGWHKLRIRTAHKLIRIDSIFIGKGEKLICSFDTRVVHKLQKVDSVSNKLSENEMFVLNSYLMPFRRNFTSYFAYIKQGNRVYLLNSPELDDTRGYDYRTNRYVVSPYQIAPLKPSFTTFILKGGFKYGFWFEKGFEYDFQPDLLKMRTHEPLKQLTLIKQRQSYLPDFKALAWSESEIDSLYKLSLERKVYKQIYYNNPQHTPPGTGRVIIRNITKKSVSNNLNPTNSQDIPGIKHILLFKEGDLNYLRIHPGTDRFLHSLTPGRYKLFFIFYYNDYAESQAFTVRENGANYLSCIIDSIRQANDRSRLLDSLANNAIEFYQMEEQNKQKIKENYHQTYNIQNAIQKEGFSEYIRGRVTENGEPLPGVNVLIKGTSHGTITNSQGYYELFAPPKSVLIISFVGYVTSERIVGQSSVVDISMEPDVKALSEVVVVGYGIEKRKDITGAVSVVTSQSLSGKVAGVSINGEPGSSSDIRIRGISSVNNKNKPLMIVDGEIFTGELDASLIASVQTMKPEAGVALYGLKAANGVMIITTHKNLLAKGSETGYGKDFAQMPPPENTIRKNFRDYAFWQPHLKTDKKGEVSFKAVLPDDITNWQTFVVAMGNKKRFGLSESTIKAFKNLSANLAVPRFLIVGDSTQLIGKTLNYASDSVGTTTVFEINSKEVYRKKINFLNSHIDSVLISAALTDSLKVKYFLQNPDGYADGELRNVPVLPRGIQKTKGIFLNLEKDTSASLHFEKTLGNVSIFAQSNALEILLEETQHVYHYEYLCNEQLASKLKTLLAERKIRQLLGKEFTREEDIKKIIGKLGEYQRKEGLWGWWKDASPSVWVSVHVAEALMQAKEAGFAVNFNQQSLTDYLVVGLNMASSDDKMRMLKLLYQLASGMDFKTKIQAIEKELQPKMPDAERISKKLITVEEAKEMKRKIPLIQKLQLIELKQLTGLEYKADTVWQTQKSTMFGSLYWGDESWHPYLNEIQTTLFVYKILKKAGGYENVLQKIRNYFLEKRADGYWRNTYESSQIIETILPDLLNTEKQIRQSVLTIQTADSTKTITKFPFEWQVRGNQSISIQKTGTFPVYFTAYQSFQNENPAKIESDFVVKTSFSGQKSTQQTLKAGETIALQAEVQIKKSADYVLIEIPIPAGCSYADASDANLRGNYNETYRETFRHKTAIYCSHLSPGNYTFNVQLVARYNGSYTLNPAKAELMYFPVFFGREKMKKVNIK